MEKETKCIQAGYVPKNGEPRMIPIIQSTTFKYDTSEDMGKLFDLEAEGYFYSRLQNPTNDYVAAKICALEGGSAAMLTSSGQAATFFAIFNICGAGDHVVASSTIYGGSYNLLAVTMKRMGIELKFATLDPYGCGIEMEGGKPGWYDALNGLPGLMGSSMAETCELARNLEYTIDILRKYQQGTDILRELYEFMKAAYEIINMQKAEAGEAYFPVWNRINDIKEAYRDKIYAGVEGTYVNCTAQELLTVMEAFYRIVMEGIAHAVTLGDGLIPTYFTYEMTEYVKEEDGIRAVAFRQHVLPHFLEGPVRYLKLRLPAETKREVYEKVRSSQLYDSELSMYKVNEPLAKESYELGRCRAFTPGWLENESIWLHMEYKYLLELLKSGLYQQYIGDLYKAAIPFQDEERYGRSILENSSFLASSANPDESIHGRGFVARLSGSTVEFMDIGRI